MTKFKQYRKKQLAEIRPYEKGEPIDGVISISPEDMKNGSPKVGDMIARDPNNHEDKWLISKEFFEENYEPVE